MTASSRPRAVVSSEEPTVALRAVQAAYYAFVLFIPVETIITFNNQGESGMTLSRLLGFLLFGLALIDRRHCFRTIPASFWMVAWYLAVYALSQLWVPRALDAAFLENQLTLIQMAALFLISANLFEDAKFRESLLRFYGWWSSLVAGGILLGIFGGQVLLLEGRSAIQGQDPNVTAGFFALGAVCLAGDPRLFEPGRFTARFIASLLPIGVLILAILETGSRGGMLVFAVGILALAAGGGKTARIRRLLIVAAVIGALVYMIFNQFQSGTLTAARLDQAWNGGDTAGRTKIWSTAWEMFLERPLLGYGGVNNFYVLGVHMNFPFRDTHNLLLAVLTEVGLVGAVPFIAALFHALWRTWRYGGRTGDALPFALMAAVVAINVPLTGYHQKIFWIAFAAAVACGSERSAAARTDIRELMQADQAAAGI
ncbi:MAG: O-antigen ligase family protein [Elusimicrobia bacterium]|nr:O-antigen ligase family protein [Elusimicrobiota bacterium]